MRRIRLCCTLLISACIVACATQPPAAVTTDKDWNAHRQQLLQLKDWQFNGKIAVKTDRGGDSAGLSWRQQGSDLRLEIAGPVGIKRVTLLQQDGRVQLFRNGEWEQLERPELALQESFGWSLPIEHLRWWLRGLPSPGTEAGQLTLAEGRLQTLEQFGWTLHYTDYSDIQGNALPGRIVFSHPGVEGKILLKQWKLRP